MNDRLAQLDDYLRATESDDAVSAYEEELFARAVAGDAPELGFLDGLSRTFRQLGAAGTINIWLTGSEAKALQQSGRRVGTHELDLSDIKPPDFSQDIEVLITRVPLNLDGVRQLDVEVLSEDGRLLKTMPEVPFDPEDGAVYACCEVALARTAASARTVSRVWATYEDERRELATIPFGF